MFNNIEIRWIRLKATKMKKIKKEKSNLKLKIIKKKVDLYITEFLGIPFLSFSFRQFGRGFTD